MLIHSQASTSILKKSTFLSKNEKVNNIYNGLGLDIEDVKIYDNEKQINDEILDQRRVIKKIDTNIFCTYFCFCCVRKRNNFGNVLLDEAMGIITDKLDITSQKT